MEGGICLFDAADQVWRESNKISPRYSHLKKIVALPGKNAIVSITQLARIFSVSSSQFAFL